MSRLSSTLGLDVRLQARNKVYLIVGVVALALGLPIRALFEPDQLRFLMPLLTLSGVGIAAFFLVGVLLLLERSEGTLDIVLVSPLRPAEYLSSKLLTVSALAVLDGVAVTLLAFGPRVAWPVLVLAIALRAGLVAAVGVAIAVRHRSITAFLLPAALCTLLFDLPVIWYLELWPSPLFYLWPTLPSLLLAKAAFAPVDPIQIGYACAYGALSVGVAVVYAMRSLDRFVVRGERPS